MSVGPISKYDSWKLASPAEGEPEPEEITMETKPEATTKNIATMTSAELEQYIAVLEQTYRDRKRSLRALARARKAEEEARG